MAVNARQYHERMVHVLTKSITYSDTGISDGVSVYFSNGLPKNAFVTKTIVNIKTVFNAATTNVLTLGTNTATTNNILTTSDVDETALGVTVVKGVGVLSTTADLPVYVKFTQTGTAATTGAADIVIEFVVMSDP